MKVLLIYPSYPESFWSFKHALPFINKKAAYPPLGLLTVAAILPQEWEKRLIDLNVRVLLDEDLLWADYVLISAMIIQKDSVREIISRCRRLGVKTVGGGPLFTISPENYPEIDHLVLNEGEITIPLFLDDLSRGSARHIYESPEKPALSETPVPLWGLIDFHDYSCIGLQYSRGCPFDCEFCDITSLYGRQPRVKSTRQLLTELKSIYQMGWRGTVFIVDDNFIGNKAQLKGEVLPALIEWMEEHKRPFGFLTEVSINLADDDHLLELMKKAGFNHVFIGIETPSEESLKECSKYNNINRDLLASIKKIQNYGIEVSAGFIVGFDSDTPSIFERQINFIQQSGIVVAMVGLLNAIRGTRLFERLKTEQRLLLNYSGNNTDFSINYIPKMNTQKLLEGYRKIVTTIYSPDSFYDRILVFFREYRPAKGNLPRDFRLYYVKALFKSIYYLGILERDRKKYWDFILKTLLRYPRFLPKAFTFAIYGFHFRKIFFAEAEEKGVSPDTKRSCLTKT